MELAEKKTKCFEICYSYYDYETKQSYKFFEYRKDLDSAIDFMREQDKNMKILSDNYHYPAFCDLKFVIKEVYLPHNKFQKYFV